MRSASPDRLAEVTGDTSLYINAPRTSRYRRSFLLGSIAGLVTGSSLTNRARAQEAEQSTVAVADEERVQAATQSIAVRAPKWGEHEYTFDSRIEADAEFAVLPGDEVSSEFATFVSEYTVRHGIDKIILVGLRSKPHRSQLDTPPIEVTPQGTRKAVYRFEPAIDTSLLPLGVYPSPKTPGDRFFEIGWFGTFLSSSSLYVLFAPVEDTDYTRRNVPESWRYSDPVALKLAQRLLGNVLCAALVTGGQTPFFTEEFNAERAAVSFAIDQASSASLTLSRR